MIALSPRQQQILAFIADAVVAAGRPPSQVEIAAQFGFTHQAARDHLNALARKGAIEFDRNSARGIRVVGGARESPLGCLPLIGRIAAGAPITSGEHVEELIKVDPALFRPRADYLFRVQGQSMVGIGVLSGDLVAVRDDPDPTPGGIVAAAIPDRGTGDLTLTLKRFRRQRGQIVLVSENDDQEVYPPQIYGPDSGIRIVGRYAGLIRPQHVR